MKWLICIIALYLLIVVVSAQWGTKELKRKQTQRLHHEPEGYKGQLDYESQQPRQRQRRRYVSPGTEEWQSAPPGALKKNERLRNAEMESESENEHDRRRGVPIRGPRSPVFQNTPDIIV